MSSTVSDRNDISFEQLVAVARKRIPLYSKTWTDFNESDPGITFLELFAWLADYQIYSLKKITEKNYIRFLKLLGTSIQLAKPSKIDLMVIVENHGLSLIEVDNATRFITSGSQNNKIIYESDEKVRLIPFSIKKVFSHSDFDMEDVTPISSNVDGSFFYPFGKIPNIGNDFYIGLESQLLDSGYTGTRDTKIHISFYLFEEDLPEVSEHDDEQITISFAHRVKWEYGKIDNYGNLKWVEFQNLSNDFDDNTSGLTKSGRISFNVPFNKSDKTHIIVTLSENKTNVLCKTDGYSQASDPPLYWIRSRVTQKNYEIVPRIDAILPNTIFASYGETIEENLVNTEVANISGSEILSIENHEEQKSNDLPKHTSSGLPNQLFEIPSNLNHEFKKESSGLPNQSLENKYLGRIPAGGRTPIFEIISVISLSDKDSKDYRWTIVNDFDSSSPTDYHCIADITTGKVMFGDGLKGRIPLKDSIIRIKYRAGNIDDSFVKAGSDFENFDTPPDKMKFKVKNPLSPVLGRDSESIDDAKARMKRALNTPSIAATLTDYEYLARNTPGLRVARAKALVSSAEENTVKVVVVPYSFSKTPIPSPEFLHAIWQHLNRHRILTTKVKVEAPIYVAITIDAQITTKPKTDSDKLIVKLKQKLDYFLSPIIKKEQQEIDGWNFGSPIYRSELLLTIMDIEGVDSVTNLSLIATTNDNKTTYDKEGNILIDEKSLAYLENCSITITACSRGNL